MTEIDWQPPPSWTTAADAKDLRRIWEQKLDEELRMRHGPTAHATRYMIDDDLKDYAKWRVDPEGFRADRIAKLRAIHAEATERRSHALARRLLELPDMPLFHDDDGRDCLLRSVRVKTTEVLVDGTYVEVTGVEISEWEDEG